MTREPNRQDAKATRPGLNLRAWVRKRQIFSNKTLNTKPQDGQGCLRIVSKGKLYQRNV